MSFQQNWGFLRLVFTAIIVWRLQSQWNRQSPSGSVGNALAAVWFATPRAQVVTNAVQLGWSAPGTVIRSRLSGLSRERSHLGFGIGKVRLPATTRVVSSLFRGHPI